MRRPQIDGRFVRTLLVLVVCIGVPGFAQAPGAGWTLVPTEEHAVKRVYWQLFNETEVWTRIVPQGDAGPVLPIGLIVSARFPGNPATISGPPRTITIRAQADANAFLPFDTWSFVATTDKGHRMDFVKMGMAFQINPSCESCAADAIVAEIPFDLFADVARSSSVAGEVLGFKYRLDREDLAALSEFGRRVGIFK